MVTHRCQYCDSDYPCDSMQEVSEDVYRCDCKAVDSCPGCLEHGACEHCGTRSAGSEINECLCEPCAQTWLDNYDPEPDSDPVTITELSERAHRERAELRRRD